MQDPVRCYTGGSLKKNQATILEERRMIYEMIEASWALAEKLGKHPVTPGCNCIVCINGRKRLIEKQPVKWRFTL